ncbi:MAG: FAD-dependent oxidoreductase [Rhodoglobus sp.]
MTKNETTIIIGGVAAGMSAATRLRRLNESRNIIVVERGDYVSFANCGLPYFVGGVIPDRDDLILQTPASLASRFRLDVRPGHEAIAVDRERKIVQVRELATGLIHELAYDTLILAGGSTATPLPPLGDVPVFTLRSIDDTDQITALLGTSADKVSALVIGGGFIGVEAVENLVARGLDVTLVHRGQQILGALGPELAALVHDRLAAVGVTLRLGVTVTSGHEDLVALSDGSEVRADLVINATGVHPDLAIARSAGLRVGASGGIWTDEHHRTSDPAIYAVGDGVEKTDAVDGGGALVTMAGLANRHGRAAADSIAGVPQASAPALGTSIVELFGLTIATVGWSERRLQQADRPFRAIHTHPSSHATYYPGAEMMHITLLVDPVDDLILGAQIVGGKGVDKRIDVLATAMSAGLTASSLSRLELAYAPQYGSAKDPINQLGYVAENLAAGFTQTVQWHELAALIDAGAHVLDVRSTEEFAQGSIPGALTVPLDQLRENLDSLPRGPLIVHCQVGQRGHTAARILSQNGFAASNLDGGYATWRAGTSMVHHVDGQLVKGES